MLTTLICTSAFRSPCRITSRLPPIRPGHFIAGTGTTSTGTTITGTGVRTFGRSYNPAPARPTSSSLPLSLVPRIPHPSRAMADYEAVLRAKYPAKAHIQRVVEYLRVQTKNPSLTGVLYLESRPTKMLEDCDQAEPFRQRRYFYYLSGCPLADSYLVYDIATSHSTLFIPPIDPDSVVWSGLPVTPDQALARYDVDAVRFSNEVDSALVSYASTLPKPSRVFAIAGQVSGEVSDNVTLTRFDSFDISLLKEAIEECRVIKDDFEVALLRKANDISSAAHRAVMQTVKKAGNETELQAVFVERCLARGAKNQSYDSIVASGTAAATLHYVANNAPTAGKLNLLLDAACEWDCYCADITRTTPISGKYSPESRSIYDIVLKMQSASIAAMRAGVLWEDVHTLAHRTAINGLLALGILKGDPAAILAARTSVAFYPHGLGHYLGMDTHDTGGHADYDDADPMFRYLRVRGRLPCGSVITVEPGIYFCRPIVEPYLTDEKHRDFIDRDVLERYWDVGGVRIEDNVVVLDDGVDNLTTAPKDADELERIVSGSS